MSRIKITYRTISTESFGLIYAESLFIDYTLLDEWQIVMDLDGLDLERLTVQVSTACFRVYC